MTPTSRAPLRVAVAQPMMHWSIDDNVAEAVRYAEAARAEGASLLLLPELAVTGVHTMVPDLLNPAPIGAAVDELTKTARRLGIALAFGAPVYTESSAKPFDAHIVVDQAGEVITVAAKMRLMPPGEPMLFADGTERGIGTLDDVAFAVVLCREIADRDQLSVEVPDETEVVLWPAMMARQDVDPPEDEEGLRHGRHLATTKRCDVYHSNWAVNVEAPHLRETGKSLVIDRSGSVFAEAPAHTAGLLLGWRQANCWMPL